MSMKWIPDFDINVNKGHIVLYVLVTMAFVFVASQAYNAGYDVGFHIGQETGYETGYEDGWYGHIDSITGR